MTDATQLPHQRELHQLAVHLEAPSYLVRL